MATILSIVPYRYMPPQNGGHWGVYFSEKVLSVYNQVHTIGTSDNRNEKMMLSHTHFILDTGKSRYLPLSQWKKVLRIAKEIHPDYIFCHHHYLFPLAKKLANRLNLPLYTRSYNIEGKRFKSIGKWWWPAMARFERYAYQQSDAVFFITDEDRRYAKHHFDLDSQKIATLPFGTDVPKIPIVPSGTKEELARTYQLNTDVPWFYFMGQLDYEPNVKALEWIIRELLPVLKERLPAFHILICGKGLSAALQTEMQELSEYQEIQYLGFVPDIHGLISCCQLMLNPVSSGGGVKTKVVESMAWNVTVVSSETGAIGLEKKVCGKKLRTTTDHDVTAFVEAIIAVLAEGPSNTPQAFYDYYFIDNIAARIQQFFESKR